MALRDGLNVIELAKVRRDELAARLAEKSPVLIMVFIINMPMVTQILPHLRL